jgi:hypothetical protein
VSVVGGAAELVGGSATVTIIGGGFNPTEVIAISYVTGNPILVGEAVANANGAFEFTLDIALGAGVYTIVAVGDQGHQGNGAIMLIDKVAG